jgi:hypothetical protein
VGPIEERDRRARRVTVAASGSTGGWAQLAEPRERIREDGDGEVGSEGEGEGKAEGHDALQAGVRGSRAVTEARFERNGSRERPRTIRAPGFLVSPRQTLQQYSTSYPRLLKWILHHRSLCCALCSSARDIPTIRGLIQDQNENELGGQKG